ncbi:MAG TPA: PDDEXK nuclease domain-containing protein [Candidatus Hydrogenedentes bacterium]|nr:PDDEXK nuclease domain-containing protein [Candidatus Hydrogenedentota bacterium]HPG66459.1 PDDEXK nuclease domain-containing protein [Candidatus Hydrogenedentota bacterium]
MTRKPMKSEVPPAVSTKLFGDIRVMIEETRSAVAATVNAGLTMLYWRIGGRITEEILGGKRAGYGKQILATLSQELARDYGDGFSYSALTRMIKFTECFPDPEIVATLSRQLSWSHFRELLPLDRPLQREFYAEMCRVERWSVRTLRQKIASMLYERTALSRQPEAVAKAELQKLRDEDRMTPDLVFRDPYLLDFLGLKGAYQEKDLEAAILSELEAFIMELGASFAFVARQKRISVDDDDYYLDLLFFHRDLRRLVAIELKLDKFRPGHKGQMELYLRWLDKHERKPDEEVPLGIILCAGKNTEQIELLELGRSGIHVAQYLTELPPKDVLRQKLHDAIARSRLAVENHSVDDDAEVTE